MPSNLPINNANQIVSPGTLYVVATPIGNRDDISLRALKILEEVDLIAAEDTRKTQRFLGHHGIDGRLISYHEHNEKERTPQLIARLKAGASIALVSTAGTPTVSDPGYRLINQAISHAVPLVPVPGVSAAAAALSVSGLPTDRFAFVGFLPKKKARKLKQLAQLAQESQTLIFYESPKRIITLLKEIIDAMGDRQGVMAREMTKRHEEFIRGTLSQILENLEARTGVKGECTLLVAGRDESTNEQWDTVKHEIQDMLKSSTEPVSALAQRISKKYGLPKNKVYKEALKLKGQRTNDRGQMTEDR